MQKNIAEKPEAPAETSGAQRAKSNKTKWLIQVPVCIFLLAVAFYKMSLGRPIADLVAVLSCMMAQQEFFKCARTRSQRDFTVAIAFAGVAIAFFVAYVLDL